jgi:hypothetical protein
MKVSRHVILLVVVLAFAAIMTAGLLTKSSRVHAQTGIDDQESRIEIGFAIAPVPLNLEGKNRALVGLGSYLVNAAMSCNDCHDAGPQTQFAPGRNPFFGQPKKVDPAFYLGGGRDFGPLVPTAGSPHIVSRNLTPDKTWTSRRGAPVFGVSPNHEDRRRSGPSASAVFRDGDHELPATAVRRQPLTSHALAHIPELE